MAARARTQAPPPKPKARNDAYVGLLILALLAQLVGALFLFLDYNSYSEKTPPKLIDRPAPAAVGGQQGGAQQGGAQQMGGGQQMGMQQMGGMP